MKKTLLEARALKGTQEMWQARHLFSCLRTNKREEGKGGQQPSHD